MSHPSKAKGDQAEREAAQLLADLTGWPVRRKLGAGRADDTGDLAGIPDSVCQVKNYKSITRAINECLTELPAQQTNADADYAFGLIRRPGGRWFAILDLENLAALLREATEPELHAGGLVTGPTYTVSDSSTTVIGNPVPGRNHPTRRTLRQRAGLE